MGELVERADEQDRTVGTVDRGEAIAHHRLHRVATIVCGAAEVGETYEEAAAPGRDRPVLARRPTFVADSVEALDRYLS